MKKDMQPTWDLEGRLRTWETNESNFNKNKSDKNETTNADREQKRKQWEQLERRTRELSQRD
jgi:hypothetical protein